MLLYRPANKEFEYNTGVLMDALEYIERGDFTDMFPGLNAIICNHLAVNYLNEVDSSGNKWPPRKDNLPHPLLRKTLAMHKATADPMGPGHYFENVSAAEFYTGVDDSVIFYAKYQNYGTSRIPPREFIFVTDRMADELQIFADAHLAKMG